MKTIKCEFYLCIYNKRDKCFLNRIELSAEGLCETCIIPSFPKDLLELYKKETLDRLNEGWDTQKKFPSKN